MPNCVRAKRERILIMSISRLYIQKHIEKPHAIVFQGLLEESLSFMLSHASLKSQRPGYCRAKGRYRVKNCSKFENSNHKKANSVLFLLLSTIAWCDELTRDYNLLVVLYYHLVVTSESGSTSRISLGYCSAFFWTNTFKPSQTILFAK